MSGESSLPPYPGRPYVHARWRGVWHKAIWHHVPQAMRLPGQILDWVFRQCDGFDGEPDRRMSQNGIKRCIRETPPTSGTRCRKCYA